MPLSCDGGIGDRGGSYAIAGFANMPQSNDLHFALRLSSLPQAWHNRFVVEDGLYPPRREPLPSRRD
jgi:hypothetical protein